MTTLGRINQVIEDLRQVGVLGDKRKDEIVYDDDGERISFQIFYIDSRDSDIYDTIANTFKEEFIRDYDRKELKVIEDDDKSSIAIRIQK